MSDVTRVYSIKNVRYDEAMIFKMSLMTIVFLGCVSYNQIIDVVKVNCKDGAVHIG